MKEEIVSKTEDQSDAQAKEVSPEELATVAGGGPRDMQSINQIASGPRWTPVHGAWTNLQGAGGSQHNTNGTGRR